MESNLPHNPSAESALVGAVLFDNRAYWRASEHVKSINFYTPEYRDVWEASADLIRAKKVADCITLKDRFDPRLLAELLDSAVFGPEIDDYSRIVSDCAQRRALIEAGNVLAKDAGRQGPKEALEAHEQTLEAIRASSSAALPIETMADGLEDALFHDDSENLLLSGFPTLDAQIAGFERGGLSIIGGSTGMGKSALNICLMANMAASGISVGMISLDMTKRAVNRRLACYMTWQKGIRTPTYRDIAARNCHEGDLEKLSETMRSAEANRIFVNDQGGLDTADVDAQIRSWKRYCRKKDMPPLGAVFVDHIGHLYPTRKHGAELYQRVSNASNELLAVSKRHSDVATIALCQLNKRALVARDRPTLGDLRDTGHIAQDASLVILVHRHEWHLEQIIDNEMVDEFERDKAKKELDFCRGKMEFVIGKNRNGPTGAVTLGQSIKHNVIRDPQLMERRQAA
ncbi:MAG: DnaB-like helicase C-terminal domain-containing protein [Pseudomonadota bacterium]